jgi:hypothetical protein
MPIGAAPLRDGIERMAIFRFHEVAMMIAMIIGEFRHH